MCSLKTINRFFGCAQQDKKTGKISAHRNFFGNIKFWLDVRKIFGLIFSSHKNFKIIIETL